MRLAHVADVHLDAQFAQFEPEVARRRRQALREAFSRAVMLAVEEGVEALLIGGDLYENERVSPDTTEYLRALFARVAPLAIYIAPGNHDWYGPESVYGQIEWSANVHLFSEARLTPVELTADLTLWGAAHRAPANTGGFLNGFRVNRNGVHLALFHGSERGELPRQEGKVPHAPFSAGQLEVAGFDHAFLGHYHRPVAAERHTYPGNPEPLTFGEEGERGLVVATVGADGRIDRQWHKVSMTEVADLSVNLSGCRSRQDVLERVGASLEGRSGYVRLTLTGTLGDAVDLRLGDVQAAAPASVEALIPHAEALSIDYPIAAIVDEPTVRGRFVRDVLEAELPDQQRKRVLVTGLRALEGRDDLEVL